MASPPAPPPSAGSDSYSPPAPVIIASTPPSGSGNSTTTITSTPPPPPNSASGSTTSIPTAGLIGIVVAAVIATSVVLIFLCCLCKKKKRKLFGTDTDYLRHRGTQQGGPSAGSDAVLHMPTTPPSSISSAPVAGPTSLGNSKSWFTYEELATATGGFAKCNILGEGGFGYVYKGVLPGGQLVAVKQLKVGGQQGEKEFRAEVEIISRIHHRNLVSLVGYCIAESQRLLVYDYVPNDTLEYHLHRRNGQPVMDWPTRVKIARGAARGLAYLHEDCHPRIIHRDIKSSNILLDNNFEAQVSDFGLAKLTSDMSTHVTTRVMGTFGYLAPEYASSGKLTEKSDVFSFGVVLLELVTGQKPVDQTQRLGEESLVERARPLLAHINSKEDLDLLADPSLNGAYDHKEMLAMIEAAAACIRQSVTKRPKMGQVARALEGEASLGDVSKELTPVHCRVYNSSSTRSDHDNSNYGADNRRFRQLAFESLEYGSEHSGATSDCGVNPSPSSSECQTSTEVDLNARKSQPSRSMGVQENPSSSSSNELPTSRRGRGI